MKITLTILFSTLLIFLPGCTADNESILEKNEELTIDTKITSTDIALTAEFIEYRTRPEIGAEYPDSLRIFALSSELQNRTKDTLTFLNMLCAKESFYKASPGMYKRWIRSVCWSEGFDFVQIAPEEKYYQEILIAYNKDAVESTLPDLKLGFLFQYSSGSATFDSLNVWSDPIKIPRFENR
jgi:hypothetical protein